MAGAGADRDGAAAAPVTAAILLIGDELLSGKVADENARFLIGELRELGVALRRVVIIPDDLATIAREVRALSDAHTHVITSGGVGPTHDDLTMAGVAAAFDMKLQRHPRLEALLRMYYGSTGKPAADWERNLVMADVPEGVELDAGDVLPWPVTRVKNVIVMPGVPIILQKKWSAIRESFRQAPWLNAAVYVNVDEGPLAPHLDRVVAEHPRVACGSYPRFDAAADYKVKVTLESKDAAALAAARAALLGWLPAGWILRVEP